MQTISAHLEKGKTMDDLISFVTDTAWGLVVLLAMIGAIVLIAGIAVILHMDFSDLDFTESEED